MADHPSIPARIRNLAPLSLVPSPDPFEVHQFTEADGWSIQGAYPTPDEARETASLLTTIPGGDVAVAKVFDAQRGPRAAAIFEFTRAGRALRAGGANDSTDGGDAA